METTHLLFCLVTKMPYDDDTTTNLFFSLFCLFGFAFFLSANEADQLSSVIVCISVQGKE